MLADILSRYWWMTLLRGLFWILFGIVIFARPGISLVSLTLALGVVMFVDGVINTANAFSGRKEHDDWWVLLLVGLAGIGVGVLTFYNPQATARRGAVCGDLGDRDGPVGNRRCGTPAQADRR